MREKRDAEIQQAYREWLAEKARIGTVEELARSFGLGKAQFFRIVQPVIKERQAAQTGDAA